MRKPLLLFLMTLLILPLFGKITIDESVPDEYRGIINSALMEVTEGRREVDIIFDSFTLEEELATFSISVDGERSETTLPVQYIEDEIRNILFYSHALFSKSESKLDYVSNLSFSTISSPNLKKGNLVFAEDEKGKKRGVFVASLFHGEVWELDAMYLLSVFPGMKLEKGKGMDVDVTYSISPKTLFMSTEAGVSFYTPLYPLLPYVSLGMDIERGISYGYMGLGGRTMFNLSSLWGQIPFVKNMAIDGRVQLLLKVKDKVEFGGRWSVRGIWRPVSWFSLSLGYTYDGVVGNMLSLSVGALI